VYALMKLTFMLLVRTSIGVVSGVSGVNAMEYATCDKHYATMYWDINQKYKPL
jgi:hypothetical protein